MLSLRKDVECTFGIMKKCFNMLKFGFRQHSAKVCADIFVACCVLHNMLLDWDGRDDWENFIVDENDPSLDYEESPFEDEHQRRMERVSERLRVAEQKCKRSEEENGHAVSGSQDSGPAAVVVERSWMDMTERQSFYDRIKRLICHYSQIQRRLHS